MIQARTDSLQKWAGAAVLALSLASVAGGGTAAAQGDAAAAEALFAEGRELMSEEQWSAAARKFRASDHADPSVGARLSLGDCLAELGKTASAWSAYREASNLARQRSDDRRARAADERAAELEPELGFVVLEVPEPARVDGLELLWDGQVRPPSLWGQRFPVDPGSYTVTARAEGHREWTREVAAGEPGAEVPVEIPALERLEALDSASASIAETQPANSASKMTATAVFLVGPGISYGAAGEYVMGRHGVGAALMGFKYGEEDGNYNYDESGFLFNARALLYTGGQGKSFWLSSGLAVGWFSWSEYDGLNTYSGSSGFIAPNASIGYKVLLGDAFVLNPQLLLAVAFGDETTILGGLGLEIGLAF